jgi:predicted Zn-ribbon and HTH transcriptional regulator
MHVRRVSYKEKLLSTLLKDNIQTITPKIGAKISYPQIENALNINSEKAIELLNELWEEGYLLRTFHSIVYSCPYDGTTHLRPKLVCPECKSEDIERVELVEHLGQGHVDIEKKFLKDGKYVCPVCNKTLKTIGVDYRKPGNAYHCLSCNALNPEPLRLWACILSGHTFTPEEAGSTRVYSYNLNPDKVEELQQRREPEVDVFQKIEQYVMEESPSTPLDTIQQVAKIFRVRNYDVRVRYITEESLGKRHAIDIYASKKPDVVIIIGFILDPEKARETIDNFLSVVNDIETTRAILVAVPTLDQPVIDYARENKLSVVDGVDIYEAIEKLEMLMDIEEIIVHKEQ